MPFNNKLYQLRKQKGLSQEELAGRLNVSRQTVSKWEVGDTTPEMDKLVDLANLFQISLDELILDKEGTKEIVNDPTTSMERNITYLKNELGSDQNKLRLRKWGKYFLYLVLAVLGFEIIVMLIYVLRNGFPAM